MPTAAQLEDTLFGHIKPQMVKTKEETGEEECQDLMTAANTVRGWLCNPCGETNLEGMGVYDCLHREIWDWIESVQAGSEWLRFLQERSEAKKKADKESLDMKILEGCKAVFEDKKLLERVKERVLEIAKERSAQIHAIVARKVKIALPEVNPVGDEQVKELIEKEINKAREETKKGPYTGLFVGLPADSHLSDFAKKAEKEIVNTPDGDARFCRLQETTRKGIKRDDNAFSKPLYRLLWFLTSSTPDEARWKAAAKDVLVYAAETKPKRAAGKLMPYQSEPQEPLFPFFTNCLGQPLPDGQQALWGEFEQAALATAADDIFKYKIKTDKRSRQVERLRALKRLVEEENEAKTLEKEDSPLGRKITARGMFEDARWKGGEEPNAGVVAMMRELVEGTPWAQTGYRLRKGTIGGWSGLRKRFLRLEAWKNKHAEKRNDRLPTLLAQAVVKEQTENRQGFGSADFFVLLTKPCYHHLWTEEGAQTSAAKKNGITDFIHYFATYSEWVLELTDLFERDEADNILFNEEHQERIRPISYTFPGTLNRHGKVSQRHLRLDAAVATRLTLKLFHPEGTVFVPRDTEILVSARRLKRDRIITPEGSSLAAVWCPPLLRDAGANLLKDNDPDKESKRVAKLKSCWEDLTTKALVQDKLPDELRGRVLTVFGVADDEGLKVKLAALNGNEPEALVTASRISGILDCYRRECPDSSFEKKNAIVSLDRLKNSLAAFPLFSSSLSLMVEPRTAGEVQEPTHLKVSVGLSFTETISLKRDVTWFPHGSLRGHKQKELRRFWKWPCDLQSAEDDEADTIKTAELWCGDGTTTGFNFAGWKYGFDPKKNHKPKKENWYGAPTVKEDFHILSVDLGNRFAAAFARLRVHRDGNVPNPGRVISPDHGWMNPIYAQLVEKENRILRLQGENAMVWDHKRAADGTCLKDGAGNYIYELQPEIYGNDGRGRFPTKGEKSETEEFENLAYAILPKDSPPIRAVEKLTYAEMGDHLVWRLKRRISRIRTLFKLRWMIHEHGKERNPNTGAYDKDRDGDKRAAQQLAAIMMLGQFYTRPKREEDEKEDSVYLEVREALTDPLPWQQFFGELKAELEGAEEKAKSKSGQKWDKLRTAAEAMLKAKVCDFEKLGKKLDEELNNHLDRGTATSSLVERVANWCLPLRHRKWHWHSDKTKPELKQGKEGEYADHVPKVQGMRGLGMKRLEQVLNLRQLCQSYAKIEKRWLQDDEGNKTGINDLVIPRNAVLHDPCVELLDKSNELREQRVYQTAHLILTEALGVKLKNPMDVNRDEKTKKQLKSEVDLHGEYQPKTFTDHNGKKENLPKCSVIVLEDLSRYRTSQERTKSENSRLMQWAHRKIVEKLVDMAKPFGITIMLVDPAWSSRFDNRTGAAGIRVNEVVKGFETTMPYAAWLKRKGRGGKKNDLSERIKALAAQFNDEKHAPLFANEKDKKKRTLLIGVDGGERFLPVTDAHRNHAAWDRLKITLNADKNAAVNIGLLALAHPDRLDIFSRIKTEKKGEGRVRVRNRRGFFASSDDNDPRRELRTDWNAVVENSSANGGNEGTNEDEDGTESSEFPDYFAVTESTSFPKVNMLPDNKRSHCHTEAASMLPGVVAYERPLFLTKVQEACYDRIKALNAARIEAWKEKAGG